jgi:hypothetical protein
MSAGPLRRTMAVLGLLALLPVAWLLATGALTPETAALRAGVVLVAVLVLGNLARLVLTGVLHTVEGPGDEADDSTGDGWDGADRRASDTLGPVPGRPA